VLLAAGLENLGIETALVEVPGHLFLAFNTGLPIAQRQEISTDADLVVEVNGKAWIPVEATLVAASFAEAWAEGARKFRDAQDKKSLQLLMLRDTWQSHAPATLAPAQYVVALPGTAALRTLVQREYTLLLDKSLERQIEPYRALIAQGIDAQHAQLQIGIQYAKSGLYERALGEFERLVQAAPEYSAAAVAMGNAYYLNKSYTQALDAYTLAERLAPDDAGIKLDLALSLYAQQNTKAAAGKFREAAALDAELARRYETFGKLLAN
jgi:tetratricopeptide (TPR) repeat protein